MLMGMVSLGLIIIIMVYLMLELMLLMQVPNLSMEHIFLYMLMESIMMEIA